MKQVHDCLHADISRTEGARGARIAQNPKSAGARPGARLCTRYRCTVALSPIESAPCAPSAGFSTPLQAYARRVESILARAERIPRGLVP